MVIYYKILKNSSHHKVQIEAQVSSVSRLNIPPQSIIELKARKSLLTAVYIVSIFWLCYFLLPVFLLAPSL